MEIIFFIIGLVVFGMIGRHMRRQKRLGNAWMTKPCRECGNAMGWSATRCAWCGGAGRGGVDGPIHITRFEDNV